MSILTNLILAFIDISLFLLRLDSHYDSSSLPALERLETTCCYFVLQGSVCFPCPGQKCPRWAEESVSWLADSLAAFRKLSQPIAKGEPFFLYTRMAINFKGAEISLSGHFFSRRGIESMSLFKLLANLMVSLRQKKVH